MIRSVSRGLRLSMLAGATVLATAFGSPAFAAPGVTPRTVDRAANPATSFTVDKLVETPAIPPKPDIVFLVDTTGSMGPAITNVQTNLHMIVTSVRAAQPSAQFAVTSYKDVTDGAALFTVNTPLTADETAVQAGVDSFLPTGGGDTPEAWINGLFQVSNDIAYRPDSSRIVVLVGDASSHDPSNGHTLADATAALVADAARVVAVNVESGLADGLNAAGQAASVVAATGGQLLSGTADEVTAAILAGLGNLPVTVTPQVVSCETGLAVTFNHAATTVTSGSTVPYVETVAVAAGATQGATLHCTVRFLLNGEPAGDAFTQTVAVRVNDVTAPTVTCEQATNPAGHGTKPSENGFYVLSAVDNVDPNPTLFIRDSASSAQFGPYASGTTIKLTQSPDAIPEVKPGTGDVDWKVKLKGDALVVAIDAAGNESAPVTCLVPEPPK